MGYIHSSSSIMIPSGSAYCPSKRGFVHPVHSVVFGAQENIVKNETVANNRIVLNFIQFLFTKKPSKYNLHHLSHSFRSIFIFSSVVYIQYTPSSKRNLYSKIIDKSEAVYFFMFLKWLIPLFGISHFQLLINMSVSSQSRYHLPWYEPGHTAEVFP